MLQFRKCLCFQPWTQTNLLFQPFQAWCHIVSEPGQYWFSWWPVACLTHWGRVMHKCVGNLTIIVSDNYLNQCWNIVNWTLKSRIQWNFNLYLNIFIQEKAFENVVCEMAAILSRPQTKPLPEPVLACQVTHYEQISMKFETKLVLKNAFKEVLICK